MNGRNNEKYSPSNVNCPFIDLHFQLPFPEGFFFCHLHPSYVFTRPNASWRHSPLVQVFALILKSAFILLLGTNVHEAKKILTESGLPITAAENLDDAAKKAVAAIKK